MLLIISAIEQWAIYCVRKKIVLSLEGHDQNENRHDGVNILKSHFVRRRLFSGVIDDIIMLSKSLEIDDSGRHDFLLIFSSYLKCAPFLWTIIMSLLTTLVD